TYAPGAELPSAPRLDHPVVAGLNPAMLQSRLKLPPDLRLAQTPDKLAEQAAQALLQEAEARMQMCRLWATAGAIQDAQREQHAFLGCLAQARATIAAIERAGPLKSSAALQQRADRVEQENAESA